MQIIALCTKIILQMPCLLNSRDYILEQIKASDSFNQVSVARNLELPISFDLPRCQDKRTEILCIHRFALPTTATNLSGPKGWNAVGKPLSFAQVCGA